MASDNRLELQGLNELRAALKALPQDLTTEAAVIVQAHTEAAERQMYAQYPDWSGDLREHLGVNLVVEGYTARGTVYNTAFHAWIFENGTQGTRYTTGRKSMPPGLSRGQMPAGHVFIPIAMRHRSLMLHALVALVRRAGFYVSGGEAAAA